MLHKILVSMLFLLVLCWGISSSAQIFKMKHPPLKEKPAIVIAAFGTSTKAQVTFDLFDQQLRKELPGYEIRWAFTSDIIRAKMNKIYAQKRIHKRLHSLQEVLAKLEAEGYRKVVVQPLHIFPGIEYKEVLNICKNFPGLRIVVGEPLFTRWETIHEVLDILSKEFLKPKEGINILAAHGTDVTCDTGNITYLGLDWLLNRHFPNVMVATVEGIPDAEGVLKKAISYRGKKVKFIPIMYVAGDHVMNDIFGEEESWRAEVEKAGKKAECVSTVINGKTYYKGLGMYPEINEIFIKSLKRYLEIIEKF
ncbi:sirohydrochlorin cobaltochelatase [Thermodesulfatator autotrophicus]|uniref:Cobalamin biosynthesis protein CbiK n=1 Tax=Thermodesulfatator autotrophicus TaxID=1795632 RepID=A0A177E9Y5_9BACT|nr:sirohydrochlorin cobaltochelatase [Thermodesulfatator autotrophicus]OAG28230.1 hypothetical protein TH606_02985 [Thermodesulfatator autotrophicus]